MALRISRFQPHYCALMPRHVRTLRNMHINLNILLQTKLFGNRFVVVNIVKPIPLFVFT